MTSFKKLTYIKQITDERQAAMKEIKKLTAQAAELEITIEKLAAGLRAVYDLANEVLWDFNVGGKNDI